MKKNISNEVKFFLIYSLIFAVLYYFCYGIWFDLYNKSYFRFNDGLDQHYLFFVYIGKLGREFLHNIFVNHTFEFNMLNIGMGYGSDIITSLGANIGDIFYWFSIFFLPEKSEFGFAVIIIIKIYITGLAYSYFAFYRKMDIVQTLCGAIIYVFSATMVMIFCEPNMLIPMYIFPFVVVGIDKIWNDKKDYLVYLLSLAFMFINYFYFGYMTAILVFVYCLVKFLLDEKINNSTAALFEKVKVFFLYSVWAIAISMFLLLPIIIPMFGNSRIGADYYTPVLFDKNYYVNIISGLSFFYNMFGRDCQIGYGFTLIPCVIILLIRTKKYKKLVAELLLMLLGLCLPFWGKIMNGFGYTCNRWVWAFALCVSFVISVAVKEYQSLDKKEKMIVIILSVIYAVVLFVLNNNSRVYLTISIAIVIFVLLQFLINNKLAFKFFMIIACASSMIISNYYIFNVNYNNYIEQWIDRNAGIELLTKNPVAELLDSGITTNSDRYDKAMVPTVNNLSWLKGIGGMDFYMCIYNNGITRFHDKIALLTNSTPSNYNGLDRRSDLEYLVGVNHFFVPANELGWLPFGYYNYENEIASPYGNYQSYSYFTSNTFVHGINSLVSRGDAQKYGPYELQELMMKYGIVDEIYGDDSTSEIDIVDNEIKYGIKFTDNIVFNGDSFDIIDGGGLIYLYFDPINNSELYCYLDNIDYSNGDDIAFLIHITAYNNDKIVDTVKNDMCFTNNRNHMYGGRHTWGLNLGITYEPVNYIVLEFTQPGHYSINDIRLYAEPIEQMYDNPNNLPSIANNITIENNVIAYDISQDCTSKYMLVSIPYSSGWHAYIDGKERPIRLCDEAFMLIPIYEGDVHVELKYMTPGLIAGICISTIAFIILIYMQIVCKRKDK